MFNINPHFIRSSVTEAFELIILHSPSLASILNRKIITKGVLFRYLSDRKISVTHDLSKQTLIETTIKQWKDKTKESSEQPNEPTSQNAIVPDDDTSEHFPIHQMARQFTTWFYQQCNSAAITANDFWNDARGHFEMVDQSAGNFQEELAEGSQSVVDILLDMRQRSKMFFNPNVSHAGVQGRIDPHGLVMVLSCGTIHSEQSVIGCFESVFGLIRDPFAINNWKLKLLKIRLKRGASASGGVGESSCTESVDLRSCETLQPMLALPFSSNDLN